MEDVAGDALPVILRAAFKFADSKSRQLLLIVGREVHLPEVCDGFHQLDAHGPFAALHGAHIHDPAFLFFASTLVHNQNALARSHPGGQRERPSVSVHGEHVGELTERFLE